MLQEIMLNHLQYCSFPGGASGKEPGAKCSWQKKQVWPLGWETLLEEGMALTPVFLPHLNFTIANQHKKFFTYEYFVLLYVCFKTWKTIKNKKQIKVFFKIIFYWDVADLQCFVSFRYTTKWFSYTDTYFHKYMSVPFSQFMPPPTHPLITISLLSTTVTLFSFCK